MDVNEIKSTLKDLEANLTAKSKEIVGEEIKNIGIRIEALENVDTKASLDNLKESVNADIDGLKSLVAKIEGALSAKALKDEKKGDFLTGIMKEKFEEIRKAGKEKKVSIELKDMTLGNTLTGDQPRDYSNTVIAFPGQLVNVADLIPSVQISGGTYTFPRETGKTGGVAFQVEGASKSANDYTLEMVDVSTDFLAGITVYSKKMANNLPFLESFIPMALRRDYWKAENASFEGDLAAGVTASTVIVGNEIERLISEIAALAAADYMTNGIVVNPVDFYNILVTEKSTGAGYGLPGVVTFESGVLRINGIPVYQATWVPADKYYVGDWSSARKVVTQGLGLEFSEYDADNFRKNNITARIEAQIALAIERPEGLVYGDFTAVV